MCDLADEIHCDQCLEHNDGVGAAPVSLLQPPRLWQCVGMDGFEFTRGVLKQYLAIFVDIAARICAVGKLMEEVPLKKVHVPSTEQMIECFSSTRVQHKPRAQLFPKYASMHKGFSRSYKNCV